MAKEMLINVSEGEECRIALVEDGHLEELYMERTSATSHVNNIYKGRVTNVEPSIQAAFIDFGLGRNGFLHISDLMPTYFGKRGEEMQESVGRKLARRDRPPIQKCLRRGDELIVQIIKEGIGTKGPTLSTYLSVAGRFLVMMPGMVKNGVSRKIEDDVERRRLRQILDGCKPPTDCGFIVRTAGVGKTKAEISRDLTYLARLWTNIKKKRDAGPGPMELYTEGDLVTRTVRDVFTSDVDRIVVDNEDVARKVKEFFKIAMPRTKNKVDLYEEPVPLFHKYGIEREIEQMYSRHVPLPSGGSLVIDSTEAIVAIDVNSGRFRDHSDAETTAYKTDLEAADEIPRQLRLRDLGGVIICDFIDLRFERHRRDLEERLHNNLRNDRAKTKMLAMSQFGIIEMTRQRMRPSLKRSIYFDCPHCKGAGLVKTPESMGLDVMRRLAIAMNDERVQRLELAVCPDVAFVLQNRKRQLLSGLEARSNKTILIHSDVKLGMDEMRLDLFDARDGLIFLEELGMVPQAPIVQQGLRPHHPPHQGGRPPRNDGRGRGRGRGRNDQRDQRPAQQPTTSYGDESTSDDREEAADAFDRGDETSEVAEGRDELMSEGIVSSEVGEPPARMDESPGEMDIEPSDDEERAPMNRGGQRPPPNRGGDRPPMNRGGERPPLNRPVNRPPLNRPPLNRNDERPPLNQGDDRPRDQDGAGPGTGEGEGGGRRRRRRRRGRGGRGRGGQGGNPDQRPNVDGPVDAERPLIEGDHGPDEGEHGPVENEREPVEMERGPIDDDRDAVKPTRAPVPQRARVADEPEEAPVVIEPEHVAGEREPNGNVRHRNTGGEPTGEPQPMREPKQAPRRRGSRGRGGRAAPAQRDAQFPKPPPSSGVTQIAKPAPKASPKQAPPPQPVVRTGSTDRHLVQDEPVMPQPVTRPRTYRDLDHIPDDLD